MRQRSDASINAELKSLRLRIAKLEKIILSGQTDAGSINTKIKQEKKG